VTLRVLNPYDDSEVCALPFDQGDAVERKLAFAHAAQEAWARVPLAQRIEGVRSCISWFEREAEQVARDVTLQMGKPIEQARGEVRTLLERADYMLGIAEEALAPDILDTAEFRRRIEHAPLGVVLDIVAWNYPLIIAVNVVVPALVAGNAVLIKHSAKTPLCGRAFTQAFSTLEPRGLVDDLILSHEATAAVVADHRIAHVSFTGSTGGGRRVYASAAERLLDAGLELGGNDPAYVAEDADVEIAAAGLVDGACYNAGQSCCGVERVYVHESVHDAFVDHARHAMERYRLGDPTDDGTTMGPLATADSHGTLEDHVRDATRHGARVLLGGGPMNGSRFWLPTLLVDVPQEATVMGEESFGPLLPVCKVSGDEEAVAFMNDSPYGLTASVWTSDIDRALRLADQLEAGTIYRNRCDYLDPALPWTGWKESGMGSTLSTYGYLGLTRRKAINFRL